MLGFAKKDWNNTCLTVMQGLKWTINVTAGKHAHTICMPDRMGYIRTAINNAGFDADSTKAEPDSYKMLPPIYKRTEEGGGPQKGKPCNMPPNP